MKKIILIGLLCTLSFCVTAQNALYQVLYQTTCSASFRFIAYDASCGVLDYSSTYSPVGTSIGYDLLGKSTAVPGTTSTVNVTWTGGSVPSATSWGVELTMGSCVNTYSFCNLGTGYCNNCLASCCNVNGVDWGDMVGTPPQGFLNIKF